MGQDMGQDLSTPIAELVNLNLVLFSNVVNCSNCPVRAFFIGNLLNRF